MSEFCEACWNEMFGDVEGDDVEHVLSKELELCEGCAEYKHVVIGEKGAFYFMNIRFPPKPRAYICIPLYFLFRLLILPYLIFQEHKQNKKQDG